MMVRGAGLEPARHCWRQDLNLVRLPISPPAHDRECLSAADKNQCRKTGSIGF